MSDPSHLEELGIQRIPVPIPFKEAGGPINVYLIEDEGGGLCLFDAGLGTLEAETALRAGFAALGRSFQDVRRIVLSHGHIDHFGAAELIRGESGATVFVHDADREKTTGGSRWSERQFPKYAEYMKRLGLGEQAIDMLAVAHRQTQAMARPLAEARPVGEGEVLRFARFEARVLHVPGHTPGQVVLFDAAHKLLFSADHVLEKVSPNPLLELGAEGENDKHRSLVSYLVSAKRAHGLEADWILPGHDVPFQGHRRVLEGLLAFYERRQEKILRRLAERPAGALELCGELFPRATPRQMFLVLSEVVGNLEVLEERGAVVRDRDADVYAWRCA